MTRSFEGLPRITINPQVMGGKPCIRGMRVTVGMIIGELGGGATVDDLLREFPYLEREDVLQAIDTERVRVRVLPFMPFSTGE